MFRSKHGYLYCIFLFTLHTFPNVYRSPKEISAARNAKQASAKKAAPGINGSARSASWRASKAVQTEPIEALIHPFSKIIREGTNCILL